MTDLKRDGNILYISSADVSVGNGPGVNEREFILGLNDAIGPRAHFLIPEPRNDVPELPRETCTFCRSHHNHSPLHFPLHVHSQIREARRLIKNNHYDLLLFRLDVLPIAPYRITRQHRIPFALKTLGQGVVNTLPERGGILGRALTGVNSRLIKTLVDEALVADSVSQLQVDFLSDKLSAEPGKIVWIDNAVNCRRFRPVAPEDCRSGLNLSQFDPIVGYVGSRPAERGGRHLLEAAPKLLEKYPRLGVVILGNGEGLGDLKRRANELGMAERCVFPGYVPFDDVPRYIGALDVGVSISFREDRRAASELKVRQYLACGKPVVASPGSNDFLIEERLGSLVDPNDFAAVGGALDAWLSSSGPDRVAFADRVRGYVLENMTIDAAVNKRLELWSERLRQRSGASQTNRDETEDASSSQRELTHVHP